MSPDGIDRWDEDILVTQDISYHKYLGLKSRFEMAMSKGIPVPVAARPHCIKNGYVQYFVPTQ